jgi:hypothetical protein
MEKMKKLIVLLVLFTTLAIVRTADAQQYVQSQTFTGSVAPAAQGPMLQNSNVSNHTLTWTVTNSVSACTVKLETSPDNVTWSTMSGSATQTCTSSGTYTFAGVSAVYVRFNVATLTATGTVQINYYGYTSVPSYGTNDGYLFIPENACGGAVTGTVGSGNATDIVTAVGGARVFRLSSTAAGASVDTFTCVFTVPSRLTAGKGVTITDLVFLVSDQTTQATSVTTPTLKSFTAPLAVDPETANSATFVTAGGTITFAPTTGQFAAYTPVAAGQYFTIKATLGTPIAVNNDLQVFQVVWVLSQSASAAMVLETPGFFVHYNNVPL